MVTGHMTTIKSLVHTKLKMGKIPVACKYELKYPKLQDVSNSLEIKSYQVELEKARVEEIKSVMGYVNEIRSDLESLKTEVFNMQENQTDYLREKMYDMEAKISQFKGAIKEGLLNLLRDENSLNRDLQFTERRLEEWGKPINDKIFKPFNKSSCKAWGTNDGPAVQFQKFLAASGGHCGGWAEQDHFLFLRERKKFKGKDKFLSSVQYLLPDLSFGQIEEHEKWYCKYNDLRNSQKEAIQKWRIEKETQHKTEKSKVGEQGKQIKKVVHQQINISERIKEWKNQKLLKKLEEGERQEKEKERFKKEEKRRAEMHEMKKLAVSQYKAEKQKKAQETFPKEIKGSLTEEAKVRNSLLLKSFRCQDLQFIEKKKMIRFQIQSKANERAERWRLAKPALEFVLQRNPQRIFQPTLIWSLHCVEAQKRDKISPIFDLNSIPRLAIPEWRKELK